MERMNVFRKHGINLHGETDSQVYGDCIFCGKHNKFYINKITYLWDCKVCGKKGNINSFLKEVHAESLNLIDPNDYIKLSKDRKLPVSILKKYQFGWSGSTFLLPIYSENGSVKDLRSYKPGRKMMSTPTCTTGLLGIKELIDTGKTVDVYLCEGEWDTIAMSWLLRTLEKKAIAIGVPGANTFKKEWIHLFEGRNVNVVYDNDNAGENGQLVVKSRINGIAREIKYLNWFDSFPKGCDIRDIVAKTAIEEKKPKKCFKVISSMLETSTRRVSSPENVSKNKEGNLKPEINWSITLKDVHNGFRKWLHMKDVQVVDVCIAVILANYFDGDPNWLMVTAPPGGMKTEIISTFSKFEDVYTTSSLTSSALISGAPAKDGIEPSMLAHLDGKVLVIKDFTAILSKRDVEKDEIFGIFRDAYDGSSGKTFGTGERKHFNSRFGMLCGVTDRIYELGSQHAGLGERFLKFFVGSNLDHEDEELKIEKAMDNVNHERKMRDELSSLIYSYLHVKKRKMQSKDYVLPVLTDEYKDKFIALAQWGARMRGTVNREKYKTDIITARPSAEVGTRLGKTLKRLSLAISEAYEQKEVNEYAYQLIKKVALDTISQRNEDILRVLYKSCPTTEHSLKTHDVCVRTRYPLTTTMRVLNDMSMLKIVAKVGPANKHEWTVSEYMRKLISKANLYTTEEELSRPLHSGRRLVLRKRKTKKVN